MRDFEVEEHLTDDGAVLVVSTKRRLLMDEDTKAWFRWES